MWLCRGRGIGYVNNSLPTFNSLHIFYFVSNFWFIHIVPGPPSDVRPMNFMNGPNNFNVTIQWTPPLNSGSDVVYTVEVAPPPVSGSVMDTSDTQVTVTLLYNMPYSARVFIITPCRGQTQDVSLMLGMVCFLYFCCPIYHGCKLILARGQKVIVGVCG